MTRTPRILAVLAIATLGSACQTNRPIVTVNDDAGTGMGGTGVAGTGGSTAGTGGNPTGNHGGAATPCDGAAVIFCADDATMVCNLADCPGGPGGVGGNPTGGAVSGVGGNPAGGATGTAGAGQVGVGTLIHCPSSPPTGACSVELMNCAYPDSNSSCRCTSGSWSCTACPATAQATAPTAALCRYGNLTCSQFGCGVCPDAHPTAGTACGNARFKCEYGNDVCLCGGNDGWKCTTLSCPQSPTSAQRPSCASFSLSDGSNISFDYACSYAAEQQSCACNDSTGFGTFYCGCPAAQPAEGGACIGPSPCSYGGVTCNCSAGHWQCGGGACPANKPTAGAACTAQVSCSYAKDGGTDFCACNGSAWSCS